MTWIVTRLYGVDMEEEAAYINDKLVTSETLWNVVPGISEVK